MKLLKIKPSKSLNKAYFKQSLSREQMELFKKESQNTFNHIDEKQDEEYHKNVIADLFKNVYCKDKYLVNVNKKEDLVIRLGNNTSDDVGVLLEFKKPTEKRDMVSAENANVKALQELVLYYLRQTVDHNNHKITNLVVTNIYEWFIFDGVWFEKNIFRNTKLKKDYLAYKTSGHDTKYFYENIAAKYLAEFAEEIPCTYFNLLDYRKNIEDSNPKNDDDLIDLYKILSPEHLLNKKFANDSNSLNTDFYNELLYIIGLEESTATAKKTIRRINEAERNAGSFIENTIAILKTNKYLGYDKSDEIEIQYYETALELCITWLNRILFLKLLESQLINYHKNADADYSFLSPSKISEFDELQELFFDVLAEKIKDRKPEVLQKYKDIPYLNSSLFEQTELEAKATRISGLKDRLEIPVYKKSVLKKGTKEEIKPKTSLKYLLEFLDAYNFASESNAKIQEENKSIINASVLGLIFEKINGYKDGSFFTPGFITMYMCRETIRKAVVEKFKTGFPYCEDITEFDELKDKIDYTNKTQRLEANQLINDIKIVDPAVGSGHFLVSALNEMIAVKSDLNILSYTNGNRVLGYTITLDNDELIIQNQETDKLFEYTLNQNNNIIPELQELQSCLFTEKQILIENCLFGVDINPKSVMICQLRLWIELLKNAYYTKESEYKELHTLPNIDINIKTGNSLISKFAIKDNVFERITGFQKKLQEYKNWVHIYKKTNDKKAKDVLKKNLQLFKDEFKLADLRITKLQNDLRKLNAEYYDKYQTYQVFASELTDKQLKAKEKLEKEINDKQVEIQQLKDNPIYTNAFEWRFEFPEVLDDKGNFVGFDVVIGNPPYFSLSTDETIKTVSEKYKTYTQTGDVYTLFYELSDSILKNVGLQSLITSNKWMRANYGLLFRKFIIENTNPLLLVDFGQNLIFDNATVHTNIILSQKSNFSDNFSGIRFEDNDFSAQKEALKKYIDSNLIKNLNFDHNVWNIISNDIFKIKLKIEKHHKPLKEWDAKINFGIKTGLNEAFIIDDETKQRLIEEDLESKKFLKPILRGRDTRKYYAEFKNFWLINIPKGYTIKTKLKTGNVIMEPPPKYGNLFYDDAWEWFSKNNFAIANHLHSYKSKAIKREDKGDYWWELRACAYLQEFEKPKIIFSEIVSEPQFYFDEKGFYPEATVFFISGNHLKYLTALLNSKAVTFFFKNFYMGGELVGKIRYKKAFLENVPIPKPSIKEEANIETLVDQILTLKKTNPQADTSQLEEEIDELVYQLYELTPEEIAVVKAS
jgi:type II restriction/modification system DNA methylase subunit YeeA